MGMIFAVSLMLAAGIGGIGYMFVQRRTVLEAERQKIRKLQREVAEFERLGFNEDTQLMRSLREREVWLSNKRKALEGQWFLPAKSNSQDLCNPATIVQMYQVTKNALRTYVNDIQQYRKKGVVLDSTEVQFAYDKIVRLTIALAQLDQQRSNSDDLVDEMFYHDCFERLERMREITNLSIAHAKQKLQKYRENGTKETHAITQLLREQLTQKIEIIAQLDSIDG